MKTSPRIEITAYSLTSSRLSGDKEAVGNVRISSNAKGRDFQYWRFDDGNPEVYAGHVGFTLGNPETSFLVREGKSSQSLPSLCMYSSLFSQLLGHLFGFHLL
jgi:hypothetical protein